MKLVDDQVTKLRTKRKSKIGKNKYETNVLPGPQAQVAMVAHGSAHRRSSGAGRRTELWRQPVEPRRGQASDGIDFQAFRLRRRHEHGAGRHEPVFTPASLVQDAPSTFAYGDQIYEPRNYKEEYHGDVTARYALAMSLNNATVKLAEEVGYDKVADLAKAAGITLGEGHARHGAWALTMPLRWTWRRPTPSSPMPECAFRRSWSTRCAMPTAISSWTSNPRHTPGARSSRGLRHDRHDGRGDELRHGVPGTRRAASLLPPLERRAASHDGWFAGYTSNLLCIVWVGYDDYSDIRLSGAQTAAPIWAEFMKKAVTLPQYSDARPFAQPSGVVDVQLDKTTNLLATPSCPETYSAAFIAGTEPSETCDQGTGMRGFFSRVFGLGGEKALPPPPPGAQPGTPGATSATAEDPGKKKKGFFGKIAGIFKDDKPSNNPPPKPADNGTVRVLSRRARSRVGSVFRSGLMGRQSLLVPSCWQRFSRTCP